MQAPRALAIPGTPPRPLSAPVRVRRLADFGRLVGGDAGARWLPWHAAAHALMNGVEAVIFAPVPEPAGAPEWARTIGDLRADPLVGAVVCPGAPDVEQVLALLAGDGGGRGAPPVFVDPPSAGADAAALLARSLPEGADGLRVIAPGSRSVAPGGGALDLPGTCLVGALALATAATLRPMHALARLYPDDVERLVTAGCDVLVSRGARGLVAWRPGRPLPRRSAEARAPSEGGLEGLDAALVAAVEDAVTPLLDGRPDGPALWRALELAARQALAPFVGRGVVTGVAARCDAETHEAGGGVPAVEIVYRTPRRVRTVTVRVAPPLEP